MNRKLVGVYLQAHVRVFYCFSQKTWHYFLRSSTKHYHTRGINYIYFMVESVSFVVPELVSHRELFIQINTSYECLISWINAAPFPVGKETSRIVRELQVILLTFSRGKSILLSNCRMDVQHDNSGCCQFFLWASANTFFFNFIIKLLYMSKMVNFQVRSFEK